MKITVISMVGAGNGLDENTLVPAGSTVGDVVALVTNDEEADSSRWLARRNGVEAGFDDPVNEGDRITVSARKVAGA